MEDLLHKLRRKQKIHILNYYMHSDWETELRTNNTGIFVTQGEVYDYS